ncbi:MAG: histidine kinase [Chitinophagales bacterium]|nr:histidine kinase [Chitinophagales bacterium]
MPKAVCTAETAFRPSLFASELRAKEFCQKLLTFVKVKRITLHILFWFTYLLIVSYLNIFLLNTSYAELPWPERLFKCIVPELVMLPVKAGFGYYIMYAFLPRFIYLKSRWKLYIECFVIFLITMLAYRTLLFGVIYKYIDPTSYPPQTFLEEFPRYVYRALDIFSVVGLAATIKIFRMRLQHVQKEKQLVEEKLASELHFLRAQTNPHFLFNTLNNIYVLARKKSDSTADVVMQLSKILRFMLYECTKSKIVLQQEIQLIEDYISLEKIRYGDRLTVNTTIQIENAAAEITPLLLLPFVENAFKHGASETRFHSVITIVCTEKNDHLHFAISNSKDDEAQSHPAGLGLTNIKRQLELLYSDYSLDIDDSDSMFHVKLFIHLNSNAPSELYHSRR